MRRALLAVLSLLLALPVGGWLVLRVQARRLGQALVTEAAALEARRLALPSATGHGSVLACLARECDAAPDVSRTLPWTLPEVRAVIEGRMARTSLPAPLDAEATRHAAWLGRVVACGHLDEVSPTPGLGPFPDVLHPRRQSMPRLLEAVGSLAPLAMRADLEAGRADEALDRCGALLVPSAALARLEGLEALLPALVAYRAVLGPCREAFDAAGPGARAQFTRVAADVRGLLPGFDEVMALERMQQELNLFGAWLPGDLDAQLPEGARQTTARRRGARFERGLVGTLALRLYWRRFDEGLRAVEAAARAPVATREAALRAAEARLRAPWLEPFFSAPPVDPQYHAYAGYVPSLAEALERVAPAAP